MPNLRWIAMALLLVASAAPAQQGGAELLRQADQALAGYSADRGANAAKLLEARQAIDRAVQLAEVQALARAWFIRGDIYNETFQADMVRRQAPGQAKAPLRGDNDALVAFESYQRGLAIGPASARASADAVKGVGELQGHLAAIGMEKFEAGEHAKAFLSLQAALQAHDLLKARGQPSLFDAADQHDGLTFATAMAAINSSRSADALKYFDALYRKGNANATVYEALSSLRMGQGDLVGATKVLEEGRRAWPDDTALLFGEVNLFLRQGRLPELILRLKQAIAKEPGNAQLYATLGNVYDNLYQTATRNDPRAAAAYLAEAGNYYQQAVTRSPGNAELHYNLGALHYNRAALLTQERNKIEGNRRADLDEIRRLELEMMAAFDQALPHLQKAESLAASDLNSLIALSEIYARKNDPLANEFKNRIEIVKRGGAVPASYFKR